MDTVVRLLAFLALAYGALCGLLYLFQDRLMFFPRPLALQPRGPHVEPVSVPRGDVTLRGWIVNPHAAGPLLIYFGGNAEELSTVVEVFRRLDASTVLINYRGFGESDGAPAPSRLVADARVVVDRLARARGAGRPLILFGRSIGSGIAAHAADAADVDAMILMSPYRSLTRLARQHLPFVPVTWLLRHRLDTTATLTTLPERLLVIYGTRDHIIPAAESLAVVRRLDGPTLVEFSAGHNVPLTHPDIWPHVQRFVKGTQHAKQRADKAACEERTTCN